MGFFKPKSGLPDDEKARVEFHLQQLAECIGFDLMQSDFVVPEQTFGTDLRDLNQEMILKVVGEQLHHDVRSITVLSKPKPLQKCGGGG